MRSALCLVGTYLLENQDVDIKKQFWCKVLPGNLLYLLAMAVKYC